MLEPLLGSKSCERVLVFLRARGEGYASQIAQFYDTSTTPIQQQLERLQAGGILVSRQLGRTRLFQFNPRYLLRQELFALLDKAISLYPKSQQNALLMNRRRPRRPGKPL